MHNNTLATILGQALADSDAITLPGIEAAVGEIALYVYSVSGPEQAEKFMARVRSSSFRWMSSGVTLEALTLAEEFGVGMKPDFRSDLVRTLTRIEASMTGSTSPSL